MVDRLALGAVRPASGSAADVPPVVGVTLMVALPLLVKPPTT